MTQEIPQEGKLGSERERKHGFKTIIGFNGAPESNVGLMIPIAQVGDVCFQVGTERPSVIPRGLFDVYLKQGLVSQTNVDLRLDRDMPKQIF